MDRGWYAPLAGSGQGWPLPVEWLGKDPGVDSSEEVNDSGHLGQGADPRTWW